MTVPSDIEIAQAAKMSPITEVAKKLGTEGFTLVDNRTREEFLGKTSGYSYHNIAGRIEGAVYGCAGELSSSSMYYYRNIDKSMRNGDEILALWKDLGIDTGNHISFMYLLAAKLKYLVSLVHYNI